MKIQRTRNAARNMVSDGALKVINILLPFAMRSIVLHYLGVEFLGLGGMFTSLLHVLNLAELGVGSAMVFSMYRPIAEDDTDTICALMNLYRKYYRLIGLFIAVVGIALTPFLRNLIKGDVPDGVNLYILYFMNLAATVLTYWLFAYKNSLLNAHQRVDVSSMISLIINILQFILRVVVLALFQNYYLFLLVQIFCQIAQNIIIALRVDRMYPQYEARGDLPKEKVDDIKRRIRDLFTARFSAVVSESVDTLVITSFMGLVVLAVYQNYFYILSSVRTVLQVVLGACIAGVGNSLVTETADKNYRDLRKISILFCWLLCICSSMLLCLYQPFMRIWMGEENLLGLSYVICFTVYFYSFSINRLVNMFKDAAGIWHKDRFRPLTAALVNLGLNLATVRYLGLYGVLLSTVISIILVQIPWLIINLFQEVFPVTYRKQYAISLCGAAAVAFLSCAISFFLCGRIVVNDWAALFIYGAISFAVPNLLCFLVYRKNPLFRESVRQVLRIFHRK
ncbi:MAG: polysaccharide biosynthesis protein [Lachnospiraceae bacterium]|nr:polysaccharide biosynthesis protein [Lachnospiraceae bacterium]